MIIRIPDGTEWNIARVCKQHKWASLEYAEEDRLSDPAPCPMCAAFADEPSAERYMAHKAAGRLGGTND